jgi:hypothetical protein
MKYIFSLLLFFITNLALCQVRKKPKNTFCWGNKEHHFFSEISNNYKYMLDSIIAKEGIDTINCKRVTFSEKAKFISKKYLIKTEYKHRQIKNIKGKYSSINDHHYNGFSIAKKHYVLILYTKDKTNNSEILDIYSIE